MNEKLKPCPFCGGEAEYSEHIGANLRFCSVKCGCGACRVGRTKEEAIMSWNKRTYDVGKVVEQLENADPQEMMSEEQRSVLNYAIDIVKAGGENEI